MAFRSSHLRAAVRAVAQLVGRPLLPFAIRVLPASEARLRTEEAESAFERYGQRWRLTMPMHHSRWPVTRLDPGRFAIPGVALSRRTRHSAMDNHATEWDRNVFPAPTHIDTSAANIEIMCTPANIPPTKTTAGFCVKQLFARHSTAVIWYAPSAAKE